MTDTPTPEAVEPMTPIRALATLRRWSDHMRAENSVLHTRAGIIISADAIDTVLSVAAKAHSRALPAPRRYTGGPLEDGLYLCRPAPHWFVGTNGWWLVDPNTRDGKDELSDIVETSFDVWLIGPIHIPPIPESEEASS